MNKRKFEVIIVDDEPAAISTLEKALSAYPDINVQAHFTNPAEAITAICLQHPDILFLDIDMPGITGIELLDRIHQSGLHPIVVFVTAFDKYAIEAIHRAAFDYLVKPLDSKDLDQVIIRIMNYPQPPDNEAQFKLLFERLNPSKRIKLPTSGGFIMVHKDDILYVEADWNYTDIFYTNGEKTMVSSNLGNLEKILPASDFCRISRSIIINLNYLQGVNRLKREAILLKDGKKHVFKIPILNIRKLEARLDGVR